MSGCTQQQRLVNLHIKTHERSRGMVSWMLLNQMMKKEEQRHDLYLCAHKYFLNLEVKVPKLGLKINK